jgi:hypothetical protein
MRRIGTMTAITAILPPQLLRLIKRGSNELH